MHDTTNAPVAQAFPTTRLGARLQLATSRIVSGVSTFAETASWLASDAAQPKLTPEQESILNNAATVLESVADIVGATSATAAVVFQPTSEPEPAAPEAAEVDGKEDTTGHDPDAAP